MALVEIDETELINYRNITGAVQKMLANPQTRSKILEAQKIINPNAVIPELDAQKPAMEAVGKAEARMAALEKKYEDDKAAAAHDKTMADLTSKWEAGRVKAKRAGYTAEGLEQLEAFMETNGVASHEIAMPAFERINPKAEAVDSTGSNRFDPFQTMKSDGDDMKLLLDGDDQHFLNKRIKETLTGVRSGNL